MFAGLFGLLFLMCFAVVYFVLWVTFKSNNCFGDLL